MFRVATAAVGGAIGAVSLAGVAGDGSGGAAVDVLSLSTDKTAARLELSSEGALCCLCVVVVVFPFLFFWCRIRQGAGGGCCVKLRLPNCVCSRHAVVHFRSFISWYQPLTNRRMEHCSPHRSLVSMEEVKRETSWSASINRASSCV